MWDLLKILQKNSKHYARFMFFLIFILGLTVTQTSNAVHSKKEIKESKAALTIQNGNDEGENSGPKEYKGA